MKKEIANLEELEARVKYLQELEKGQKEQVKADASILLKGMRPSLVLKSMVVDLMSSRTVQKNVIDTSVGMGAGILAKKIFTMGSAGFLRRMAGRLLQVVTTRVVTKKMPLFRHKIVQ